MFKPRRKGRGDIVRLGDLFDKYKKTLIAPQSTVIEVFCEVVKDLLDYPINKQSVSYNPNTKVVSITGGGPLKSEIKLHETDILIHMKGRLGEKNAPKRII